MNKAKPPTFKISTSTHVAFYLALYFLGFFVGSQIGWVIAIILTGLEIIQPPWHIAVIFLIANIYLPIRLFVKKVPAICPTCGGTAFLHHGIYNPIHYVCTNCGQSHKTGF